MLKLGRGKVYIIKQYYNNIYDIIIFFPPSLPLLQWPYICLKFDMFINVFIPCPNIYTRYGDKLKNIHALKPRKKNLLF